MQLEIITPMHITLKYEAKINTLKKKAVLKDGTHKVYKFYVVSMPQDVFRILGCPPAVDFTVEGSCVVMTAGTDYTVKKRGNNISVPKQFFNVKNKNMTFTVDILDGKLSVIVSAF